MRFSPIYRRIAQYRLCLERDAGSGIIPAGCVDDIDACFKSIAATLELGRAELEGAGPGADRDGAVGGQLLSGCASLALAMFGAMYRRKDPVALCRCARDLRRDARRLIEQPVIEV